jgi:hypothetical protein
MCICGSHVEFDTIAQRSPESVSADNWSRPAELDVEQPSGSPRRDLQRSLQFDLCALRVLL